MSPEKPRKAMAMMLTEIRAIGRDSVADMVIVGNFAGLNAMAGVFN